MWGQFSRIAVALCVLSSFVSGGIANAQLRNAPQLNDVSPGDWAYRALRSLVDRYDCIIGYPDKTFKSNDELSRLEYALNFNYCMEQINNFLDQINGRKISENEHRVFSQIALGLEDFRKAIPRRRNKDDLARLVSELESNQFSTTTKLVGEAVFGAQYNFGVDGLSGRSVAIPNEARLPTNITLTNENPRRGVEVSRNNNPVFGSEESFVPFLGVFGGINALGEDNIGLPGFNQFLNTDTGGYAGMELGIEKRISDRFILNGSFMYSSGEFGLDSLGNNPPFVGSLPLGGEIQTHTIAPLIGVSWEVFKDDNLLFRPWVKAGGGLAFQRLKATSGGAIVLRGSETTAMATVRAGLDFPINDFVSVGVGGYVNWFDGFNVAAGPGVSSLIKDRTEFGGLISLKLAIREGGRTFGSGR